MTAGPHSAVIESEYVMKNDLIRKSANLGFSYPYQMRLISMDEVSLHFVLQLQSQ